MMHLCITQCTIGRPCTEALPVHQWRNEVFEDKAVGESTFISPTVHVYM